VHRRAEHHEREKQPDERLGHERGRSLQSEARQDDEQIHHHEHHYEKCRTRKRARLVGEGFTPEQPQIVAENEPGVRGNWGHLGFEVWRVVPNALSETETNHAITGGDSGDAVTCKNTSSSVPPARPACVRSSSSVP